MLCLKQEFFQLAPDSLGREIRQIYTPAKCNRFRIDVELKTSRKLRRTQHAQTIFYKRGRRDGTQESSFNIQLAVVWIDQFSGERILENGVDREVAPSRGFGNCHRRIARDHKSLVTGAAFTFAARDGNVEMPAELVD